MGKKKVIPTSKGKVGKARQAPLGSGMLKRTGTAIKKKRQKQADIMKELGY